MKVESDWLQTLVNFRYRQYTQNEKKKTRTCYTVW